MNTLGVYTYLLFAEHYDLPYREMIRSVAPIADEIIVVGDSRFKDGTYEAIQELIKEFPDKLKLHLVSLDLDDPGVDGKTKALARSFCESSVLMQMDGDEVVHERFHDRIRTHVDGFQPDLQLTGTGVINYFNGNRFKYSAAGWTKERFSWNVSSITHGIPINHRKRRGEYFYADEGTTDGAGYIDAVGRGMSAEYMLCQKGKFPRDFCDPESVYISHYSWFGVPRKWQMQDTWDHFWGQLYGKHQGLADYHVDRNGDPVVFWEPRRQKSRESYEEAVMVEMKERTIHQAPSYITHPAVMDGWMARQKVYEPGNWWRMRRAITKGKLR